LQIVFFVGRNLIFADERFPFGGPVVIIKVVELVICDQFLEGLGVLALREEVVLLALRKR